MSQLLETRVPEPLSVRLAPDAPLCEGFTVLLITLSESGHPDVAMLSCGEVVVGDPHHVSLALWPRSTATANLSERPRCTLSAVADGTSWTVQLSTREAGEVTTPLSGTLRRFEARPIQVKSDRAPYATLDSGVTFHLNDPERALPRWRELRAALAKGPSDG